MKWARNSVDRDFVQRVAVVAIGLTVLYLLGADLYDRWHRHDPEGSVITTNQAVAILAELQGIRRVLETAVPTKNPIRGVERRWT